MRSSPNPEVTFNLTRAAAADEMIKMISTYFYFHFPHGTYLKSEGLLTAVCVAISVINFLQSGMAPARSQPSDRTGVAGRCRRAERASEPPALSDLVMTVTT